MTDERGVIRSVAWRELFPWLIILRTFHIAVQPALLAAATAAMLVTPLGWWLGDLVFLTDADRQRHVRPVLIPPAAVSLVDPWRRESAASTLAPYYEHSLPLWRLADLQLGGVRPTAYYLFGWLWTLAVWALVGGFITRYAVVRLATESEPGLEATARYAVGRYAWYALAPLYPLMGAGLIAAPIALLGLPIYFSPGAGSILAGLLWVFVVLASLAAAWLLAGLIFGWPLMWPTISAERDGDPFEAFSRSFAYVYGKPLHYLGYVVVAALFGGLCLLVVHGAAMLVTEFGFWALSWGAGGERATEIRLLVSAHLNGVDLSKHGNPTLVFGSRLFAVLVGLIQLVAAAFSHTFFWSAASAIYLLLRMDVDEKEMDEVYGGDDRPRATATRPAGETTPRPADATPPAASPAPSTNDAGEPPIQI